MIHNRLKFTSLLLVSSRLRGRVLDWRLSQPGFDLSYGNLVCLATLMSSDRTKQICLWVTVYIYIYIYIYIYGKDMNTVILLPAMGKIVGQTGLFNLGIAAAKGEGKAFKLCLKIGLVSYSTCPEKFVYIYIYIYIYIVVYYIMSD